MVSLAGCLCGWNVCISIGKCRRLCTVSTSLPWNLLALLMLLVCQSVQYSSSSNKVSANGWGKPESKVLFCIIHCIVIREEKQGIPENFGFLHTMTKKVDLLAITDRPWVTYYHISKLETVLV